MIANYTRRMMRELEETGRSKCLISGQVSPSAARSRLWNAARRLGVKITTTHKTVYQRHIDFDYVEARVRGSKVLVTKILPGTVLENGWTVHSVYMNHTFGVVLAKRQIHVDRFNSYATWCFRVDQQATYWGHYFIEGPDEVTIFTKAREDFLERCANEVTL